MSNVYSAASQADAAYDAGLRSFLLSVYNKMGLGLLLTALLAYLASQDPLKAMLFTQTAKGTGLTILGYVCAFGPIGLILLMGLTGRMFSALGSAIVFWGVAAMFGLSMGTLFMQYTGVSLATTFAATAGTFGALSLFGYTTKKNLSGIGNFCFIALIGLIIASLINVFMHSTALNMIITYAGILIFAGLIAYDTQKMKSNYADAYGDSEALTTASNLSALDLYLDFINMFLLLLRLLGDRK